MSDIAYRNRLTPARPERHHDEPQSAAHHGKVMLMTLNRSFVAECPPGGIEAYMRTLVEVAARQLSVTQTIVALGQGWARDRIRVGAVETERLAEQLSDPARVGLIIEDEAGHRLVGTDCELSAAVYDDGYHEPGDAHRPFYS